MPELKVFLHVIYEEFKKLINRFWSMYSWNIAY